ncbi:DUF6602 domain-containing protein [Burkholderia vietnamiensis]|uniref:DUF6602 domain-containing protein n=1 Tax=Burkholderia vietnamiensis TaxID=60552 RepID=UPI00075410DD|nr:DUF6602 domain-containing protein [Burkholderia vietnamiensis]KVF31170.1 hypothetical protein WJ09_19385 [Burkholderia vietnamiensis]
MDITRYLKSISAECQALKNRVRDLIDDHHWGTDGAWKESVLRAMISRTIPTTYSVASGFVITEERPSTQIDILIYDNSIPVLYKGGDLVFVPPSACAAIIEVKTSLDAAQFREAATKVADICELIQRYEQGKPLFSGIFAYDGRPTPRRLLEHINHAANGHEGRIVNHVSIGTSSFVKYWPYDPASNDLLYKHWHHYELQDLAPGYFLHNLMSHLTKEELVRGNNIWFPLEGKEARLTGSQPFTV